jgi:hypothetical protein
MKKFLFLIAAIVILASYAKSPSIYTPKLSGSGSGSELRWANRYYIRDDEYRVTHESLYFKTVTECEKMKSVIEKNNPLLWWAKCR